MYEIQLSIDKVDRSHIGACNVPYRNRHVLIEIDTLWGFVVLMFEMSSLSVFFYVSKFLDLSHKFSTLL